MKISELCITAKEVKKIKENSKEFESKGEKSELNIDGTCKYFENIIVKNFLISYILFFVKQSSDLMLYIKNMLFLRPKRFKLSMRKTGSLN